MWVIFRGVAGDDDGLGAEGIVSVTEGCFGVSGQTKGVAGWMVDRMIRRSVRRGFHTVYWTGAPTSIQRPSILVVNHHGWHDGYLMYLAATRMNLPVVDWIQEFDSFPLFGAVGGMPFPADDPVRRMTTIRQTLKLMRDHGTSLVLFAEGELHPPDSLLKFGRSLEFVVSKTPGVMVVPVAIRYELSMHERPEAYLAFGPPVPLGDSLAHRTRLAVASLLDRLKVVSRLERDSLEVLFAGTKDVNERLDWRQAPFCQRKPHDPRK